MRKLYDLKDLKIVILAKMTEVIKPTSSQLGHYKSKTIKGAYFAKQTEQAPCSTIYEVITKKQSFYDNPERDANKGAKYILKKYDAYNVFAKPIQEKGKSKLNITQLRALEKVFRKKGYVKFDKISLVQENKD